MTEEQYRYQRKDFGPMPVKLNHLDIFLNFLEDAVEATNTLDITAITPLSEIVLDARELEVLRVEWVERLPSGQETTMPLGWDYRVSQNKLVVPAPRPLDPDERFWIRTFTRCHPSTTVLEGIYKDSSPAGAPQQYMSQCQQWGFQRIMPIFDDCRAKCTMTTTLEADARYTHLISNGNISRELNPDGKPILKPGDPTRQVIRYQNRIPMAPYLLIACAGTWDVLADEVTYDTGRSVRLEYLVPPGMIDGARMPMEILKQAVLWIKKTQDYEYQADTYRTICMNKSNFGGMENTGNTTIVTDRALIDEHTLDAALRYAHAVIVHEFEHNQCGSETTMETPFDVWLNEAYTVDVERQFLEDVFDAALSRLAQVDAIRSPLAGPLALEDGGRVGRIVREGFNDPDELIDGVTYVKAAEVIRMLRLVVGRENFLRGKELYFTRYKNGNANSDEFFACFEEAAGRSLEQFKRNWLFRIGYPQVTAVTRFDAADGRLLIEFRQKVEPGQSPFHLPVRLAAVNAQGDDIPGSRRTFELTAESETLVIDNLHEAPAFVSLNRNYSFYGTFSQEDATRDRLALQARLDPNRFNRVEAMRRLTDLERIKLLNDPEAEVDSRWLAVYGEVLADTTLPPGLKAYMLGIEEQPLERQYCTWFRELVVAKDALIEAVNAEFQKEMLAQFHAIDTYRPRQSPKDGIEDRMLKNTLLDLIAVDDSADSHDLIVGHYRSGTTATDRMASLLALNRSSSADRKPVLHETYQAWLHHIRGYANYLAVVGSGTAEDVFEMIEAEKKRPTFDMSQPAWVRALVLSMGGNTRRVWSDAGIRWVADTVIELASVNWHTAGLLLNSFQHLKRLKPEVQAEVRAALERIIRDVPESLSPVLHAQAKAYLG